MTGEMNRVKIEFVAVLDRRLGTAQVTVTITDLYTQAPPPAPVEFDYDYDPTTSPPPVKRVAAPTNRAPGA